MRAQTTLDFAIGMAVFLVAVVFTLTFVPGLLTPFTDGGTEHTVTANRVAASLSEGLLADPDEPYILDKQCTIAFFESRPSQDPHPIGDDGENLDGDGTYSTGGPCNWADVPLEERLGVRGLVDGNTVGIGPRVNVTLQGDVNDVDGGEDDDVEILCVDANSDNRTIDAGNPFSDADGQQCDLTGGDDDVWLAIGKAPPESSASIVVARRIVSFDGHDVSLVVKVW